MREGRVVGRARCLEHRRQKYHARQASLSPETSLPHMSISLSLSQGGFLPPNFIDNSRRLFFRQCSLEVHTASTHPPSQSQTGAGSRQSHSQQLFIYGKAGGVGVFTGGGAGLTCAPRQKWILRGKGLVQWQYVISVKQILLLETLYFFVCPPTIVGRFNKSCTQHTLHTDAYTTCSGVQ